MQTSLRKWVFSASIAVALGVAAIAFFLPCSEASELTRVFIRFSRSPGTDECHRIAARQGRVRYVYRHQPVIAVEIPRASLALLSGMFDFLSIEPDVSVELLDTELDASWGVKRINAGLVHATNTGAGVKIAVVDTGIDYTHPDLDDNYAGGYDFINDDADPADDHGHGTHVAGIIAAEDNDFGVVGVAPDASLFAVKVISATGSGSASDLVAGIEWCIDNDVDVINMSMHLSEYSQVVDDACEQARESGILLVAAAGNSGTVTGQGDTVVFPALLDSVIAVGATDQQEERGDYSSTGPAVELAAPGTDVYSLLPGGTYGTKTGTSMASPHAAGAAALIWADNPTMAASEIRIRLRELSIDLGEPGRDSWYGFGRVRVGEIDDKSMYVWSIDFSPVESAPLEEGGLGAVVTVRRDADGDRVAEADDIPVSGASVVLQVSYDGDADRVYEESWEMEGTSGSDGVASFVLGEFGRYEVEVTGLEHPVLDWYPGLDRQNPALYSHELVEMPVWFDAIYPNPTRGGATIRYVVEASSYLEVEVWSVAGEHVALVREGYHEVGTYSAMWDGMNDQGEAVARGLYLVTARSGSSCSSFKLAVIR